MLSEGELRVTNLFIRWRGHAVWAICILAVSLLLSGCVRLLDSEGIKSRTAAQPDPTFEKSADRGAQPVTPGVSTESTGKISTEQNYEIIPAKGGVIGKPRRSVALAAVVNGGDVSLNFVDADVREVMKATLGAILNVNFTVAPEVQGAITVQSGRPISRAALLPTLETILRLHGLAIVKEGNIFRIQPLAGAAAGNPAIRLGISGVAEGEGYGIQVVPLYYVSAAKMAETLRPIARKGSVLHVDETRNVIMIGGTRFELVSLLEAIEIFDVNWLAGMSFGLFRLNYADPQTLAGELDVILGDGKSGVADGMVRLVPIKRMNAILAVSRQPRYLDQVRQWVARLDKVGGLGNGGGDQQLFIYFVQNGKAADLAEVLNKAFGGESGGVDAAKIQQLGSLAPGLEPVRISSTDPSELAAGDGKKPAERSLSTAKPAPSPVAGNGAPVRIIADEERNALLISGTQSQYRAILGVLNQLDRRPLEVLIEVTIADVTLSDSLQYGVRWFFQTDSGQHLIQQGGLTANPGPSVSAGLAYTYSVTNAAAVLDVLSDITEVEVISAPQLMVLNNQEARLQVGDQVPFPVASSIGSGGELIETNTLVDTGVILKVTPRVNESGLVLMDISQEVSASFGGSPPTIFKRNIDTTVAVQSGQTIALGGLIQDNKTNTKVGIPFLSKIPFFGALFRSTTDTIVRNELLVLVTPRIVRDERGAFEATQELRHRMEDLERLENKVLHKHEHKRGE